MVDAELKKTGKKGILKLSGELTLDSVGEIKEALVKAITRFKALEIVFGDITGMDFSFLQLICSAHKTATHRNRHLAVAHPMPPGLEKLIAQAGFTRHTGCDPEDRCECFWVSAETSE